MLGHKGGVGGQFHRICYWTVMSPHLYPEDSNFMEVQKGVKKIFLLIVQ